MNITGEGIVWPRILSGSRSGGSKGWSRGWRRVGAGAVTEQITGMELFRVGIPYTALLQVKLSLESCFVLEAHYYIFNHDQVWEAREAGVMTLSLRLPDTVSDSLPVCDKLTIFQTFSINFLTLSADEEFMRVVARKDTAAWSSKIFGLLRCVDSKFREAARRLTRF